METLLVGLLGVEVVIDLFGLRGVGWEGLGFVGLRVGAGIDVGEGRDSEGASSGGEVGEAGLFGVGVCFGLRLRLVGAVMLLMLVLVLRLGLRRLGWALA